MTPLFENISLVLACYESGSILSNTLLPNLETGFGKIIIIDGNSKDDTRQVVDALSEKFPGRIEFYQYPKKGLANARNLGTSRVRTGYVVHAGPDNIIPKETLERMLTLSSSFDLVSCQTQTLVKPATYLQKAHKLYKKRFAPGPQAVVGTPYFSSTALFRDYPFNEEMLNSDDTELCSRLKRDGMAIYRSRYLCFETGFDNLPAVIERWMRWGRGDALFYNQNRSRWKIIRKIKSWFHPFKAEIIDSWTVLNGRERLFCLPFLMLTLILRYLGWLRYLARKK